MSNPSTFMNNFTVAIQNLVNAINALKIINDQVASDSSLFAGYFALPNARTDINATSVAQAYQAGQNMVAAYNASGQGGLAASNLSYLVKMTQP